MKCLIVRIICGVNELSLDLFLVSKDIFMKKGSTRQYAKMNMEIKFRAAKKLRPHIEAFQIVGYNSIHKLFSSLFFGEIVHYLSSLVDF